jgi:uncharacterized protein (DUF1810 family)
MAEQHFDLERFVQAQDSGGVYERALAELRAGRKRGHWMWFVFPQIAGLGRSPTSQRYAIVSADEARAYLRHPLLGPRLRECADAVLATGATSAEAIFGPIDVLKARSSMTLFAAVAPGAPTNSVFTAVLDRYYGGVADPLTIRLLGADAD